MSYELIDKHNRSLAWSLKHKIIFSIITFILAIVVAGLIDNKAYAYTNDSEAITAAVDYFNSQSTYDEYILIKAGNYYELLLSTDTFRYYLTADNEKMFGAGVISTNGNGTPWENILVGTDNTWSNPYLTLSYSSMVTVVNNNSEYAFIQSLHDVLMMEYSSTNGYTETIQVAYTGITQSQSTDYTYQYDSTIPNVANMTIEKDAIYRNSWFVIGESKNKYIIKWDAPEDTGLKMEIALQTKYNDITHRYLRQDYKTPWYSDTGVYILGSDAQVKVGINGLGIWIMKKMNEKGIDTGDALAIPVTEMYFRYCSINSTTYKVSYGNWTKLDFAGGSQGIIETQRDTVTTTETVDTTTGETVYTDTPVEGNETAYINSSGEEVDEEQSFTAAAETIDTALDSSTTSLKSVGTWVGQVPGLIGSLFTFIPAEIIAFIGLSLVMLMILKIAGR